VSTRSDGFAELFARAFVRKISRTSSGARSRRRSTPKGGNQTRAAKRLGISRRALQYKLENYDIKWRA
jgi:DNA-binding NtrC family response regulator